MFFSIFIKIIKKDLIFPSDPKEFILTGPLLDPWTFDDKK